jgi:hypothetical protein
MLLDGKEVGAELALPIAMLHHCRWRTSFPSRHLPTLRLLRQAGCKAAHMWRMQGDRLLWPQLPSQGLEGWAQAGMR